MAVSIRPSAGSDAAVVGNPDRPRSGEPISETRARPPRLTPGGIAVLVVGWAAVAIVGVVVVVYGLGPVIHARDQRKLLLSYRLAVRQASFEANGLPGLQLPTQPPAIGDGAGIVEIGPIKLREVAIEGAGPAQTERGVGHVPGTAGLGQPGNSAVVGRRDGFGGAFTNLAALRPGMLILVTTTEGQTVYRVAQSRSVSLHPGGSATETPAKVGASMDVNDLFAPAKTDRLTMVSSGSAVPWNSSAATVVVASMVTVPFPPTPQQARSAAQTGNATSSGVWPALILVLLAYAGVAGATVWLYRNSSTRVAYLLSTAPLIAAVVLIAELGSRLLPAWT